MKEKNIKLDYTVFGEGIRRGVQQGGGWKQLDEYGFLLFEMLADQKLIEHKGDDNLVNFKLEVKQDDPNLKELLAIFKILSDSTMDDNGKLFELFDNNGQYTKISRDQGLSPIILASHRDSQGKLNFRALHQVIKKLKNPTEFSKKIKKQQHVCV